MTVKVNRELLLSCLESVYPGVAAKELIEQANSFILKDGYVLSFNEEIYCKHKSPIPKAIQGAVYAKKLLEILRKLEEDEVELEQKETELIVKGKGRRAGIRMDPAISLPMDSIETPDDWKELNEEFCDAIRVVHQCAGEDESKFHLTCVHLHPEMIEACDNYQICRWPLATGLETEVLIRQTSARHIPILGMTHFCETEGWLHFKNPSGLIFGCRRYEEEYPNLTPLLEKSSVGSPATLPKGLEQAADKAKTFSEENPDNDKILVELRSGKLRIKGQGAGGWYSEVRSIKYAGEPLSFMIAPDLLVDLVKRFNDCVIGPGSLMVDCGTYKYITCLAQVKSEKQEADVSSNGKATGKKKLVKATSEGDDE